MSSHVVFSCMYGRDGYGWERTVGPRRPEFSGPCTLIGLGPKTALSPTFLTLCLLLLLLLFPFLVLKRQPTSCLYTAFLCFLLVRDWLACCAEEFSLSPIVAISRPRNGGNGQRVLRWRKLNKDKLLRYKLEQVLFLLVQVRKIKETDNLLTRDVERLLLLEDNHFDFINEVAAEANQYVENNRDEHGGTQKAILHVMSNRVNDMGFKRPEAYTETDPYKAGPGYLKQDFT